MGRNFGNTLFEWFKKLQWPEQLCGSEQTVQSDDSASITILELVLDYERAAQKELPFYLEGNWVCADIVPDSRVHANTLALKLRAMASAYKQMVGGCAGDWPANIPKSIQHKKGTLRAYGFSVALGTIGARPLLTSGREMHNELLRLASTPGVLLKGGRFGCIYHVTSLPPLSEAQPILDETATTELVRLRRLESQRNEAKLEKSAAGSRSIRDIFSPSLVSFRYRPH
jgi:hypothetical protein